LLKKRQETGMSLWLSTLCSFLIDCRRHHSAVGDVAAAGIYHRAAVFRGGDDRQNRAAGGDLRRLCLVGVLAGVQRLCARDRDP
jgi:hypothetical protein